MLSALNAPAAPSPPVASSDRSNGVGAPAGRQEITVLCHGCFDLLHAGHIEHLAEAKKLGTRLVVSITADAYVKRGAWRPYYSEEQRAAHLRALSFVDDVVICPGSTAVPAIDLVKPALYVKGIDYDAARPDPALVEEITAVRRHGGDFFSTKVPKGSSSRLLARVQHGDVVGDYLDTCRARGFLERIEAAWARARAMTVAYVGETIIDEYRYVSALGKPSKEFVLAVSETGEEQFIGGVVAAAKHADRLCKPIVVSQGAIKKTRYVDGDFCRKIFEVYSAPRLDLSEDIRKHFRRELAEACAACDAVVIFDFGHGLIDGDAKLLVKSRSRWFAVNAQSNAGNQGYNPVTAYAGFHPEYVCVDLPEARLATHWQNATPKEALAALAVRMDGPNHLVITNGRDGAYCKGGRVPAFVTQPRDTIGAGDCFLAITAPLIAAGLGTEEAALVGNIAGAMKTEIVGHRSAIDAEVLLQSVRSLLK